MIKQKHVNVVLKLNCYKDVSLDEEDAANFSPERIAVMMKQRHVCIKLNYSMIVFEPNSTYMTLYLPEALGARYSACRQRRAVCQEPKAEVGA